MARFYWGLFLIIFSLTSLQAIASEDEKKKKTDLVITHGDIEKYGHQEALMKVGPEIVTGISPSEIFARTHFVLEYLHLTPEPSYQKELDAYSKLQSIEGLNKFLPFFDEKKQLSRFSSYFANDPNQIQIFMDRDSRESKDFSLTLVPNAPPQNIISSHLRATASQPLAGLRIAIDPGHMGGETWDQRTGKFVTDHKGHIISEGVINLQTSLLLKERFEREGAMVLITHETLGPVTDVKWENLDYSKYIPNQIFESTLDTWFLKLVDEAPAGKALGDLVDRDPNIAEIKAKSTANQWEDFVLREDIDARAKKIEDFNADITLVIHYDTSDPASDPNGVGTKKN